MRRENLKYYSCPVYAIVRDSRKENDGISLPLSKCLGFIYLFLIYTYIYSKKLVFSTVLIFSNSYSPHPAYELNLKVARLQL